MFCPVINTIYVGTTKSIGHFCIHTRSHSVVPYGGEIRRLDDGSFETNEMSGHYGFQWIDAVRTLFVILMRDLRLKCHHKPSTKDHLVKSIYPVVWEKKRIYFAEVLKKRKLL